MNHTYHLTRSSRNVKTGPIPVATTSMSSCPPICPLKGQGCYAEYGPLKLHWDRLSTGARGVDLEQFCDELRTLPKQQLWRYGQAGDLPGADNVLDAAALRQIVDANRGRRGFAFTHYPMSAHNAALVTHANHNGFTINLSANDLEHADELAALNIAPVAVLLDADQAKPTHTPQGRHISVCPATTTEGMSCAKCGICATQRKAIIGFPVHGTGKSKAQQVFSRSKPKG